MIATIQLTHFGAACGRMTIVVVAAAVAVAVAAAAAAAVSIRLHHQGHQR
jgi:hypothetical protein